MQTFVITLPETPDKKEKCAQHLKERRVVSPRFFDGVYAERFGLKTVFPYEVDHPGSGFNIGFMPVGCWLSHWCLWSVLSFLHEDIYMILEDDVCLPEDWHSRTMQALADVPKDFDMLYVGSCCCVGKPTTHVKGEVYDVRYPLCTHAYIVAGKALPVLLASQRRVYAPIDINITFHAAPLLKVYTVLPRIMTQFDTEIPE